MLVCAWALVALIIQYATCRHIAICSLSGFTTLSHKHYELWKKGTEHEMLILIFFITFI
jgi:hypothetical protein